MKENTAISNALINIKATVETILCLVGMFGLPLLLTLAVI